MTQPIFLEGQRARLVSVSLLDFFFGRYVASFVGQVGEVVNPCWEESHVLVRFDLGEDRFTTFYIRADRLEPVSAHAPERDAVL